MHYLTVAEAWTIVKLRDTATTSKTLQEQLQSTMTAAPYMLLDVEGLNFTSMMIGEVVNLALSFAEYWQGQPHMLGMINAAPATQEVFKLVKLTERIPLFDSVEEARAYAAQHAETAMAG